MLKPRQPFVGLALCAVTGVFAADILTEYGGSLWQLAAAASAGLFMGSWWLHCRDHASQRRHAAQIALWLAATTLFFAWHAFRQSEGPGPRLAARIPPRGCVIQATGIIDEEPSPMSPFHLRLESVAFHGAAAEPCHALILAEWPGKPPAYGDRVSIIGGVRNIGLARNPGGFDGPARRRRQGIYSQITSHDPRRDVQVLAHDQGRPVMALALQLRHRMEETLTRDLGDSPRLAALIQSMVIGYRGESMQQVEQLFQDTGTIHLFAVTGINVVVLVVVLEWLLSAFRVPRRFRGLIIIPAIWMYSFATGLGASTLRAAAMVTVVLAGTVIERPALPWNALGFVTVAVLAWDPNQLFKSGFVLSFALVGVLIGTARPLQERLQRIGQPDPFLPRVLWPGRMAVRWAAQQKVAGLVSAAVVAWIASIPLMIFYFHLWSPSTVPANVLGGPLAEAIIMVGIAATVSGSCWQWLSITFNNFNWLLAKWLLGLITALSAFPGSHVYVDFPSFHRRPACELEVLDLAGGGATHIRAYPQPHSIRQGIPWLATEPARDWLIDCGSAPAFLHTVSPYLRSRGVNRLDGFLLTHGDSKAIGGAPELLKTMLPGEVIDSPFQDRSRSRRMLHQALSEASQGKAIVWRGDILTLRPGVTLHVLFPPEGFDARTADDKALILRLDVEGERPNAAPTRILLTSNAGFISEHWLLEHAPAEELRSDIIIKGMHAKDLSGTPEFLEAVQPVLIVTSAGTFPPEERVSEEWASMVKARGIRLLRQDETGAVHIAVDHDGKWTAEPYLKADVTKEPRKPSPALPAASG